MTAPPATSLTDDAVLEPGEGGYPDAPQRCQFGDHPAVRALLFRDGDAYTPVCDEHEDAARAQIAAVGETVSGVVEIEPGTVTAAAEPAAAAADGPSADAGEWRVRFPVMAVEGVDTSDGRFLTPGTIIARACPMSILAQPFASHGGQEPPPAVVVGRLDTVERVPGPSVTSRVTGEPFPEGSFVWVGHGAVDPNIDVHGLNIGNLLRRRFLNGASVDLAGMDVEMVGEDGFDTDPDNPRRQMIAHRGEQAAITLVPIPAFGDAYVELVGDDDPPSPADPEEFPEGFAASAFPAWRSAEVGDYPALTAGVIPDGPMGLVRWPANAAEVIAGWIVEGEGEPRDAEALARHIADQVEANWLPDAEDDPDDDLAIVAAAQDDEVFGAHDLIFYERRSTPKVVTRGAKAPEVPESYGKVVRRRAATAEEERTIARGDWVRVDSSGMKPGEKGYDKSKVRPNLAAHEPPAMPDDEVGMPDAPQPCEFGDHPAARSLLFDADTLYLPVCDADEQQGRDLIEQNGTTVTGVVEIEQDAGQSDEETPA